MRKNRRKVLLIVILIIVIVVAIGIFWVMNINQNKSSTYDLFNKKITYNFGNGTVYEIDIPQIINDYDEIVIRNNHLLLHRGKGGISISKNETVFENLPPNEPLTSNESKNIQ